MRPQLLPHHLPRPLEVGHKISDKYVLGSEIGRGAFGTVYECQNTKTGETVAAKRIAIRNLSADQLHSLEEEVSLLKNLNHPNIVKYIGTVRTRNHLHILLEYMENGSLSQNIKKFGVFSPELVALFTRQVLQGLAYLHEQGVIHRDIKGANLLTSKNGRVKLADFGVATHVAKTVTSSGAQKKASGTSNGSSNLEEISISSQENDTSNLPENAVVGTPYWMAPEIIEMFSATPACDIWSVGCTVIELLTSKPPYSEVPTMAALYRIVQDESVPLPQNLEPNLTDFLKKCFVKTPTMRATAHELLEHPWIAQSRKAQGDEGADNDGNEEMPVSARNSTLAVPLGARRISQFDDENNLIPNSPALQTSNTSVAAALARGGSTRTPVRNSIILGEALTNTSESSASSSQASVANRIAAPRNSLPGEVYDTVYNYPQISEADRRSWRARSIISSTVGAGPVTGSNARAVSTIVASDETLTASPAQTSSDTSLSPTTGETKRNSSTTRKSMVDEVAEDWDQEFGFNVQEDADSNLGLGQAYAGPLRVNKVSRDPIEGPPSSGTGTSTLNSNSASGASGGGAAGNSTTTSSTTNSSNTSGSSNLEPALLRALNGSVAGGVGGSRGAKSAPRSSGLLSIPQNRYRQQHRAFKPMSPLVEVQNLGFGHMQGIDLDTAFEGDAPYGNTTSPRVPKTASTIIEPSPDVRSPPPQQQPQGGNATKGTPVPSAPTNRGSLARYRESDLDADFRKISLDGESSKPAGAGSNSAANTPKSKASNASSSFGRRGSGTTPAPSGTATKKSAGKVEDAESVANELRRRLSRLPQSHGGAGEVFNASTFDNEQKMTATDAQRDEEDMPRRVAEVLSLVAQLRPAVHNEESIIQACDTLCEMFSMQPKLRQTLLTHHGVIPIMEALEVESKNPRTTQAVLRLVAQISEGDRSLQEVMAMAGIIPIVAMHARPDSPMENRLQAAEIVKQFVEASGTTLQMFVACGGLPMFASLLQPQSPETLPPQRNAHDATSTPDVGLALVALSGILHVFRLSDASVALPPLSTLRRAANSQSRKSSGNKNPAKPAARSGTNSVASPNVEAPPGTEDSYNMSKLYVRTIPRNDVCRLFVRTGLLDLVALLLTHIRTTKGEKECLDAGIHPIRLVRDTASVLLVFSLGNSFVKQHLASQRVMRSVLSALSDLWAKAREGPITPKAEAEAEAAKILLKCVKNLCIEPGTLDVLESSGAISTLVPFLIFSIGGVPNSNNLASSVAMANATSDLEARSVIPPTGAGTPAIGSPSLMKKRTTMEPLNKKVSHDSVTATKKGSLTSLGKSLKSKENKLQIKRSPAALSGSSAQEIHNMVMLSMYYLTRLSPSRQEQAAASGIVPFLKATIVGPSPVKTFALQMLCDLAFTSAFTRYQLWREGVVDFFLDLLVCGDVFWEEKVLGALEVWLQHATPDVERAYLRPFALIRMVTMFQSAQSTHFEYISKALLDMITASPKLAEAIGRSGFFMAELAARLSYPKPEVRINLLKMLKIVGEHYINLENLILEHNLYAIVTSIAKDKSRVVVTEVANQVLEQWKQVIDLA